MPSRFLPARSKPVPSGSHPARSQSWSEWPTVRASQRAHLLPPCAKAVRGRRTSGKFDPRVGTLVGTISMKFVSPHKPQSITWCMRILPESGRGAPRSKRACSRRPCGAPRRCARRRPPSPGARQTRRRERDVAAGAVLDDAVLAAPAELRPIRDPALEDAPEGVGIDQS